MTVIEEPRPGGEPGQLDPFVPLGGPVDLTHRATPGLGAEDRAESLQEAPVEGGVVGDDQGGRRGEGRHGVRIDGLAGDHGVVDPRQGGDLGRNGLGRLPQPLKGFADLVDPTIGPVAERDHRQFDDLVAPPVQTRSLDIDEQACADEDAVRDRDRRPRRQTTQHAVSPARPQGRGHRLEIWRLFAHGIPIASRTIPQAVIAWTTSTAPWPPVAMDDPGRDHSPLAPTLRLQKTLHRPLLSATSDRRGVAVATSGGL